MLELTAVVAFFNPDIPIDPSDEELIKLLLAVVSDWRTAGTLGLLLAIFKLLGWALKRDFVKQRLGFQPWMLPLAQTVIALGLAFLGALSSGMEWKRALVAAVVGALTAGLNSSGLHELLSNFSGAKRAEDRIGKELTASVLSPAHVSSAPLLGALAEIEKLPEGKERAAAIAAWGKANPPRV